MDKTKNTTHTQGVHRSGFYKPSLNKHGLSRNGGFSLLELVIVLAIMAVVLSVIMAPSLVRRYAHSQIRESTRLIEPFKTNIEQFYMTNKAFPANNSEASLPEANKFIGNYISAMTVSNGAMTLHFGNKADGGLLGKFLTIRPVYVLGSPESPISWVCGFDEIPKGMTAAGSNATDVDEKFLVPECR